MRFDPQSAGGIMNTDVITLMEDFSISKSIEILQRLQPSVELRRKNLCAANQSNSRGSRNLQDIIVKLPLRSFILFL